MLCGSLPSGCSPLPYRRLTEVAHAHEVPVLINSRSPALLPALPAAPEMVKLNLEEVTTTFRRPAKGNEALAVDAEAFLNKGTQLVICTTAAHGGIAARPRSEPGVRPAPPMLSPRRFSVSSARPKPPRAALRALKTGNLR